MRRFSDSELNELEYPDETPGSVLAREIREECNKLTMQERERLLAESFTSIFEQQEQSTSFWEEMAIIEFTESVLEQLELKNISKAELAERMNVSPDYIARLLGGNRNLTLRTMVRVARALGCEFGCHLQPNS